MFSWTCAQCGREVPPSYEACPDCGAKIASAPLPELEAAEAEPPVADPPGAPPGTRVASHLRLIMVLWLAEGALRLLSMVPALFIWLPGNGMVTSVVIGMGLGNLMHLQPPLNAAQWGFVLVNTLWTLACLVVAWGLLDHARWARTYTIVVSALWLLDFPVGTALGIYTLWVLLPESSENEYRQLAMQ